MMDFVILVLGAALPSILLVLWFYKKDAAKPEPSRLLAKAVLAGFIASVPAIFIEFILELGRPLVPGFLQVFYTAFIIAALVEEGLKYLIMGNYISRFSEWDEYMDGIVYAACVSLGFAFAENLLYGFGNRFALILRAFTAVPLHASATGIMGYFLSIARFEKDESKKRASRRKALFSAILIHGLYDFFLFSGSYFLVFSIIVLLVSILVLKNLVRKAKQLDSYRLISE